MVDANPDDAAAQAGLLAKQGHADEAIAHLERATQATPNNILYHVDLAVLYDKEGRSPEALALYRQVLQVSAGQH